MKAASLALALLALPLAVAAQSAPPIDMGLWKTTNTTTVTNLNLPPDVMARLKAMGRDPGQPRTMHLLACLTPEKWRQMFTHSSQNQNCTFSNVKESSTSLAGDVTCLGPDGQKTATGHMDMTFASRRQMHGTFHMEAPQTNQPEPMKMDTTFDGQYQGADCQGIAPGASKLAQ